jgi:hypothetical protein
MKQAMERKKVSSLKENRRKGFIIHHFNEGGAAAGRGRGNFPLFTCVAHLNNHDLKIKISLR